MHLMIFFECLQNFQKYSIVIASCWPGISYTSALENDNHSAVDDSQIIAPA